MYIQTDPKWGFLPIGNTTVGKEGCLLVSVSIANTLLGNQLDPKKLWEELTAVKGFNEKGDLIWANLRETSSLVWQASSSKNALHDIEIVEYLRPKGKSHFAVLYQESLFNPMPGLKLIHVKSRRRLEYITNTVRSLT